MAWTTPLCTKDTALVAICHFLKMVSTQFKTQDKQWMSDAGGEHKSKAFDSMLKEQGICILQSAPHTPQQNSHAEQFMHTVMDKSEAMCHKTCIPESWWKFLIAHAIHVYNHTPLHHHNWQIPFEVLHGSQSDIAHLCIFGCAAYMHLPEDMWANKMAPKSELMVYIGVAPGNKSSFLFMRSLNNVLFTSAHALFNEACFLCYAKPTHMQPTAQVAPPITGEHEPTRPPPLADNNDYQSRSPAACPSSPPPVPSHIPSPRLAMPMPPAHTPMPPTTSDSENDIEQLCCEGGAKLAAFLMSKAIVGN